MTEERVMFWLVVTLVALLGVWLVCDWVAWK